jgi:uncharacterized protein YyaL (SSP411 family)
MNFFRFIKVILLILCLTLSVALVRPGIAGQDKKAPAGIDWHPWGADAFKWSRQADTPILLYIFTKWSGWCNLMEAKSFADPSVIELVGDSFIPVKVDLDARPDIGERYARGGVPTVAILYPSGDVLALGNYFKPGELATFLENSSKYYISEKDRTGIDYLVRQESSFTEIGSPSGVSKSLGLRLYERALEVIEANFDDEYGGYGTNAKFPSPRLINILLLAYWDTGDDVYLKMARKTLNGQEKLYDKRWGGAFGGARTRSWKGIEYEKLLYQQAGIIESYMTAYQAAGKRGDLKIANGTGNYALGVLGRQGPAWGFYSSQSADLVDANGEIIISGKNYYKLSGRKRLKKGEPDIDKSIYLGANARMIVALFKAYQVLGYEKSLSLGLRTLDEILKIVKKTGANVPHMVSTGKGEKEDEYKENVYNLLTDSLSLAEATLEAYQTTGTKRYLKWTEAIVSRIEQILGDETGGGYYSTPKDPKAEGLLAKRIKPKGDNARMAVLLFKLHIITAKEAYKKRAKEVLFLLTPNFKANPDEWGGEALASLGQAYFFLNRYPVHIRIIGHSSAPSTTQMIRKSFSFFEPRRVIQVIDPVEGKKLIKDLNVKGGEEALFQACIDKFCSKPISDPEEVEAMTARFLNTDTIRSVLVSQK